VALAFFVGATATSQEARMVLRWREVPDAAAYEIQIAKDRGFANPVVSEKVISPGYRWDQIPAETHWWRVRSIDAEGRPGRWTDPKEIGPALIAPELTAPASDAHFIYDSDERRFEFSVVPSKVMKEYRIEISRDRNFTNLVADERSESPSLQVAMPETGQFWWRAAATSLSGRESTPGPARSFVVVLGAPRTLMPKAGEAFLEKEDGKFDPITLSWAPLRPAERWRVVVSSSGHVVWRGDARTSSINFLPTEAGEYEWKVAGVDAEGREGASSRDARFRVAGRPKPPPPEVHREPLARPILITPPPEARIDLPEVELSWNAVTDARDYQVAVAANNALDSAELRTSESETVRIGNLPDGEYAWRVRALAEGGEPGPWSEVSDFSLHSHGGATPGTTSAPTWLRGGVQIGWLSDFAGISSPYACVEAGALLPVLSQRLVLSILVGYHGASTTVPVQPGVPAPITATAEMFPVSLRVSFEQPWRAFSFWLGIGPTLQFVLVSAGPDSSTAVVPGGDIAVGIGYRIGAGQVMLQTSYGFGSLDNPLARLNAGGLVVSAGYRFLP
jgi:hypothetical protein